MVTLVTEVTLNQIANLRRFVKTFKDMLVYLVPMVTLVTLLLSLDIPKNAF